MYSRSACILDTPTLSGALVFTRETFSNMWLLHCTRVVRSDTFVCMNSQWLSFWLIWFINQRALYSHALSVMRRHPASVSCWHWHLCTPPPGTGLDIETSYLVHIYPPYMHIKYLVILTCSFLNGSHFGIFL